MSSYFTRGGATPHANMAKGQPYTIHQLSSRKPMAVSWRHGTCGVKIREHRVGGNRSMLLGSQSKQNLEKISQTTVDRQRYCGFWRTGGYCRFMNSEPLLKLKICPVWQVSVDAFHEVTELQSEADLCRVR